MQKVIFDNARLFKEHFFSLILVESKRRGAFCLFDFYSGIISDIYDLPEKYVHYTCEGIRHHSDVGSIFTEAKIAYNAKKYYFDDNTRQIRGLERYSDLVSKVTYCAGRHNIVVNYI